MSEYVVYYGPNRFGFADFVRGLMFLINHYPQFSPKIYFDFPFTQIFEVLAPPSSIPEHLTIVAKESELPENPSGYKFLCNIYPKTSADISKYFIPSKILQERINLLIPPFPFSSVHFRAGDKYLRKNGICAFHDNLTDFEKIKNVILSLNLTNFIFHTDNQELKEILKFPSLPISPIHVADVSDISLLLDTFAEFYIISKSEAVYALVNPESKNLQGRFSTFAAKVGGKEPIEVKIS